MGPGPLTKDPRFAPSNWNCTPDMATESVALAVTVIVPVTVAAFAGAVMETVGGVVLVPGVVAVAEEDWAETLPAAS